MGHDDPTDAKKVLVRSFLHYVGLMREDYDCLGQARTLQILNVSHAKAKDEALMMLDSEIAADDPALVGQLRNRLLQNIELQLEERRNELEDLIKWKVVSNNDSNDGGIEARLGRELDQQKQHYESLMKVQLDEQKLFYETLLETKAAEMDKLKQEWDRMSSEKEELQQRLGESTSQATKMLRQLLGTNDARTAREAQSELDRQKVLYENLLKSKDLELEELRQDRERLSRNVEELEHQLECSCNDAVAVLENRAAELGQVREERDRLSNEVKSAARHKAELEHLTRSWQQMLRTKEELLEFKTAELTRLKEDVAAFQQNPNLFSCRKDEEIRQLKAEILLKDRSIEDLRTLLQTVDNSNEFRKACLQKQLRNEQEKVNVTERAFQAHVEAVNRTVLKLQDLVEQMSDPILVPTLANKFADILSGLQQHVGSGTKST
ncbi:hypothetical protein CRM22_002550 [Opisthorchis felineus]|uniref:Uncharacterized protein n=1 Tax=Opisthorchis felineus TaxID=147828 RepID=A0A4S2M5G4_OPIFE|nr:hypothetical protein CRM22_002550 [Opisthorchis felineus]